MIPGTKVYILCGHLKNYFGIIVGNAPDFDIESNTPPDSKILITDSFGITTFKIFEIS